MPVDFSHVQAAAELISGRINRTPLLTSSIFNEKFGCEAFFKAECFQKTGSFKFRGATHSLLRLTDEQKAKGVLTFSSGNHAQALARAGREMGIPITVVMPDDAPAVKKAATEGYGAEVILYIRDETSREALGQQIVEERGLTLIPPYDHPNIVAGAGSVGLEIAQEIPDLDLVLVCCGGGGLLSGTAIGVHGIQPNAQVWGVEPDAGDDGCRSFATGTIQKVENPKTVADGAMTPYLGEVNFEIIQREVAGMTSVSDKALMECTLFTWTRMKTFIEPTGALAMAAIWEGKVDVKGKRVAVVFSGGNADPWLVLQQAAEQGVSLENLA